MKSLVAVSAAVLLTNSGLSAAEPAPKIAWYAMLDAGLKEAKRSGRPILLVSGAPQCLGVSGIW